MWAAWHVAAFQRQKRLPNLDRVMRRLSNEPPKKETPANLLKMVEHANKALGGADLRKR